PPGRVSSTSAPHRATLGHGGLRPLSAGDVLDRGDSPPVAYRWNGGVERLEAEVVFGVVLPLVQRGVRSRAVVLDVAEGVNRLDPVGVVEVLAHPRGDV